MATLNVKDMRTVSKKRVTFADLSIGEVFECEDSLPCIKIDDTHCLYMNEDDIWTTAVCDVNGAVFPLRATLTIEGRE